MDNNKEKFEKLIDSAMRDVKLDTPPVDFTNKVMGRIENIETQRMISYKPIIPRKILVLIFVLFLGLVGYPIVSGNFSSNGWFDHVNVSPWLSKIKLPSIEMDFSNILTYGIVFFGMMVLIQTTILKGYFDRKLT